MTTDVIQMAKPKKRKTIELSSDAPSSNEKGCPTCDQKDHQRSSSQKCPKRVKRQGAGPPSSNELLLKDHHWVRNDSVFKKGLRRSLKAVTFSNGETLEDRIQTQVQRLTRNAFYASKLLHFHLQRCIEHKLELPNFEDRTWLRQFLTFRFKDPALEESYLLLDDLLPIPLPVNGQIVTIFCRDWSVIVSNFMNSVNPKIFRHLLHRRLAARGLTKKKHRNAIIASILEADTPEDKHYYTQQYRYRW